MGKKSNPEEKSPTLPSIIDIMTLKKCALVGINELFLPQQFPVRKYGAEVTSPSVTLLRYEIKNELEPEWVALFTSKTFLEL
jgi:hypothetical protein